MPIIKHQLTTLKSKRKRTKGHLKAGKISLKTNIIQEAQRVVQRCKLQYSSRSSAYQKLLKEPKHYKLSLGCRI